MSKRFPVNFPTNRFTNHQRSLAGGFLYWCCSPGHKGHYSWGDKTPPWELPLSIERSTFFVVQWPHDSSSAELSIKPPTDCGISPNPLDTNYILVPCRITNSIMTCCQKHPIYIHKSTGSDFFVPVHFPIWKLKPSYLSCQSDKYFHSVTDFLNIVFEILVNQDIIFLSSAGLNIYLS